MCAVKGAEILSELEGRREGWSGKASAEVPRELRCAGEREMGCMYVQAGGPSCAKVVREELRQGTRPVWLLCSKLGGGQE